MNKAELVTAVAGQANLSQKVAGDALNAIQGQILEGLKKDGEVALVGFGTFKRVTREARKGVNPATKKPIDIPEHETITFKVSKILKEGLMAKAKGAKVAASAKAKKK